MRLPLLAVLLCAAVGASATVTRNLTVVIETTKGYFFDVQTRGDGVRLTTPELGNYTMTKDEAASLGRALLEAAGKCEKSFDEMADEAACETDLKLSGDPNTPDSVRKVLMENVKRCRTRRQERALDRMVERLP